MYIPPSINRSNVGPVNTDFPFSKTWSLLRNYFKNVTYWCFSLPRDQDCHELWSKRRKKSMREAAKGDPSVSSSTHNTQSTKSSVKPGKWHRNSDVCFHSPTSVHTQSLVFGKSGDFKSSKDENSAIKMCNFSP